jgi:hypothetical protein
MLIHNQKHVAVDNHGFDVVQRAFDGPAGRWGFPAALVRARSKTYPRRATLSR